MKNLSIKTKRILIAAAALLIVIGAAAVTGAFLSDRSEPVKNDFTGKMVNIAVVENGSEAQEGGAKAFPVISKGQPIDKKVQILNKSSERYPTTDTYVRVRLVPVFRYKDGTEYAGQTVPVQPDVSYTYGSGWKQGKDSTDNALYYYYPSVLEADGITSELITKVTCNNDVPKDAYLEIQVLADAVPARPEKAVETVWGLKISQISGLADAGSK